MGKNLSYFIYICLRDQGHPAYCASKAAINAYVRSVGRYLSKDKIIMNCVMPGAILTKNGYWDIIKKKIIISIKIMQK